MEARRIPKKKRTGSGERQKANPDVSHAPNEPFHTTEGANDPTRGVNAARLKVLPSTPTRQFDLCVLVPIETARMGELRLLLEELREDSLRIMRGETALSPLLNWNELDGVHYARFVIIEAHERFGSGPMLALSTNYDGPLGESRSGRAVAQREHIARLVQVAGSALDSLYRCCEGYCGLNNLESFLAKHHKTASTFYVGGTGRCRDQVLAEAALRREVQELLDELYREEPKLEPEEVRSRIRKHRSIQALRLPSFAPQPDRRWRVALALLVLVAGVAGLVGSLASGILPLQVGASIVLVSLIGAVWAFRNAEKNDPEFEPRNSPEQRQHFQQVAQDENIFLQNELSHLVDLKAGPLRRAVLSLVFSALRLLASNLYNKGKLGNIPSIHFARWCRIDRGRRVLFFSNFDNSWESYLGDFIDQASLGLTGVWSNTEGYPRTRWLITAGSRAASRFKAWTRAHQIRTQVWYSAYPSLSIRTVNANTEIRRGLAQPSSMSARVWLDWLQGVERREADALHQSESERSTLGSAKAGAILRPTVALAPLDKADVQGLILHGYGRKKGAEFLLLRVAPGKAQQARGWLSSIPLTDGIQGASQLKVVDPFINLAFTHEGLEALELDPELLNDFPVEFVQGAAHDIRCRVNGDIGVNGPDHWKWGAADRAVHAILMVYATDPASAHQRAQQLLSEARGAGLVLVKCLKGGELPGRKEHFGFRDGISQPVVQGAGRKETLGNTLPIGEILLGHANAYQDVAYAPTSPRHEGFGRNGSYLVFRQLSQDVPAFWRYCEEQAQALHSDAVTVAAKMVGRWPSGASLVKHRQADPKQDRYENEDNFAYLANGANNDRGGVACPFGSHLRRANPRDWETGANRRESLKLASRHRIVRRGRPYGEALAHEMTPEALLAQTQKTSDPGDRGLQFLALGADIQRQFEFVQQQWSQNPEFAGLSDSPDGVNAGFEPSQSPGRASFTIQSNTSSASFGRCVGLTQFVQVLGGAYFFMPSLSAVRSLKPA